MIRWGFGALLVVASCTGPVEPSPAPETSVVQIVALSAPAAWIAERLGGEGVEVRTLPPVGEDPHRWRPSPDAIDDLRQADLIVLAGAGLEAWVATASLPLSRTVDLSRGIDLIRLEGPTHRHGDGPAHSHAGPAPYTWLEPETLGAHAERFHAALREIRPSRAPELDHELSRLQGDLSPLATRLKALGAGEPALVATHPTFVYLFRGAGLNVPHAHLPAQGQRSADEITRTADMLAAAASGPSHPILVWDGAFGDLASLPEPLQRVAVEGQEPRQVVHIALDPLSVRTERYDLLEGLNQNLSALERAVAEAP